ncbi:MAG: DEAD/DEAH box helicase [Planctomycetota bacterium]
MSQLTAWSPFFQSQARMKGRSLQLANKVKRLSPEEDELVRAQVQGERLITVSVKSDGRRASIECDSPQAEDGVFCEHIWATLLHLIHEPDGPGASIHDIIKLRPQPPKARKRELDERPVSRGNEPQWMGRLALLRPSSTDVQEEAQGVFPVQRQVCFVVLPRASTRHNGLVVELRQRTATATGWGKPKPFKVSGDVVRQLTDPVDREICALLLGAVWVTEFEASDAYSLSSRSHAMYRVAPQAQRALLKQMIATGRCYLDAADDEGGNDTLTSVTWDTGENEQDTWALYLHGVYDDLELDPGQADEPETLEDGPLDDSTASFIAGQQADEKEGVADKAVIDDLLIDLQIRRAGRRVSIEVPELVLGGPDGLVIHQGRASLFDDREAWRWVSQFRDGRYTDDQTGRSVLRVEADQVNRFLDRLYMLPHLPDLDLPERLGRAEQTVEPVPHVDLFSPNSAPAMELTSSIAKNHVVARLWFSYGEQRVSPIQPGRFVPVTPAGPSEGEDPADQPPQGESPETANGEAAASTQTITDTVNGQPQNPVPDPEAFGDNPEDLPTDSALLIRRNRRAERQAINACSTLGMRHITSPSGDALLLHNRLMPNAVGSLLRRGWVVSADQRLIRTAGPPALSITSGIDWFELRGNVSFTGEDGKTQQVALPEILAAARAGRNMVTLGDGTQGLLPQQWLEEHGLLTAMGQVNGDHVRFRSSQAAMLDALLDDKELIEVDQAFAQARERLRSFEGIESLDPAGDFLGSLRSYQRHGLGWLGFLRQFGMGGILADDMGLGKTVQVLAMVQARRLGESKHLDELLTLGENETNQSQELPKNPSIIVVPRSVVFNWVDEARKFTPGLKVLAYTGPDRDQHHEHFGDYDLIVTSYGLMRRDIEVLRQTDFDYAVLDEAQAIKNPQSQSAKAARLIQARHRLALTGTPIENHLGDLWSIFEYLNPGMLGSSAKFAELIRGATSARGSGGQATPTPGALPMDMEADGAEAELAADLASGGAKPADGAEALRQIATALRPFILRRTKSQVLDDLPEKTEQTIICEMDPEQRRIYDQLRTYYRGNLMQQIDAASGGKGNPPPTDGDTAQSTSSAGKGLGRAAFMVLEALLRLRQAACHPALIDKTSAVQFDRENVPSAKLDELEQRLDEIIDEGSKALVFSQFTSMLALIRKRLDQRGIKYAYLDGQTRNRKDVVQRFQTDPDLPVFLISLKAGGVGLNLTAAEYVFIMDPWWNPAVEAQAIDRTHRIGQKKPVFAYRLICEDTVEQRILELQSRKRDLADAVVGGEGNILANLSREDLERLLS